MTGNFRSLLTAILCIFVTAGVAVASGCSSDSYAAKSQVQPVTPEPSVVSATPAPQSHAPLVQLRLFTINRGKLDLFVQAWKEGVYPLRQKHGFLIPAAWAIEETNQFVWIVIYDGPESWETKEADYYGSDERRTMDPDPAQWIARVERWFVTPVVEHP